MCYEFICGCCPNEEFLTEDITCRCEKIHNVQLRERFAGGAASGGRARDFEHAVNNSLNTFNQIVEEVDRKISVQKELLQPQIDKKLLSAINHVEELINNQNVDSFSNTQTLLRVHGQLIAEIENTITESKYSVCENCGVFKEDEKCKHTFCESYKKIRNIQNNLQKYKQNIK